MIRLALISSLICLPACGGSNNLFDCNLGQKNLKCSEMTQEEKARAALKDGDFTTAINELEDVIAGDPEAYGLLPLLAAAYAGRAGLEILNIASAQFKAESNVLDQFSAFIPGPAEVGEEQYKTNVTDMKAAVTTLLLIPEENITGLSAEDYGTTVTLQRTLYLSSYSAMLINQLAYSASTGSIDPAKLATMSEDEALEVISALSDAALTQATNGDPQLKASLDAALAAIDAQPGDSKKEKLAAYISASKGSSSLRIVGSLY
jgi:hypothetical protein